MSLFNVNLMSITQAFEHAILKINREPTNDVEAWEREKYVKTVGIFFEKFEELKVLTNKNKGVEDVPEENLSEETGKLELSKSGGTVGVTNKGRGKNSVGKA